LTSIAEFTSILVLISEWPLNGKKAREPLLERTVYLCIYQQSPFGNFTVIYCDYCVEVAKCFGKIG